jgi:hypothetical protein
MLEDQSLVGPVHSVETFSAVVGQDIGNVVPSRLDVYDRDGFLIERYQYDDRGVAVFHTAIIRDHWTVIKEVNESTRQTVNRTPAGQEERQPVEMVREAYDSNGKLVSRLKGGPGRADANLGPNGATEEGRQGARETSQHGAVTRESVTVFTPDGKIVSQSDSQWSKKGDAIRDVMPDGSFTEITMNGDGYVTKLHMYIAETQTDTLTISDDKGRTLEDTQASPQSYFKSVFTYDTDGFTATEMMLSRAGKPTDKFRYQYQKDGQGNWIEQHRLAWHATDASSHWAEDQTIRRVIAYY